jgi:hypothetical protein
VTKVKNVRAGIVIIADAGLKLAPGETVSVDRLTAQMDSAIDAGLLARIDGDSVGKSVPKSAPKLEETKPETTESSQPASTEQAPDPEVGAATTEEEKDAGAPAESPGGAKRGHK